MSCVETRRDLSVTADNPLAYLQDDAAQLRSQATGLKGLLAARKQRAAELQSKSQAWPGHPARA